MAKVKNNQKKPTIAHHLKRAIEAKQHCLFVDSQSHSCDNEFRQQVEDACKAAHYPVVALHGSFVSTESLLFSLIEPQPKTIFEADSELSSYRKICAIIDSTEPSVIAIYDAHRLNQDGQQIVSRVARYLKGNLSNWKILLLSEENTFKQANYFQLPIEQSLHNSDYATAVSPKERKRLFSGLALALLAVFALGFLFTATATKNFSVNNNSKLNPKELTAPPQPDQTTQLSSAEQSLASSDESSKWLSNKEFKAILARLENPSTPQTMDSTSGLHQATQAQQPALSSAMIAALQNGDSYQVATLNAQGESLTGVDPKQQTALILASINGKTSLIQWLLEKGAEVDKQDVFGRSALYYSAVHGNFNAAEALLGKGANANLNSKLNKTPVMAAAHNNYPELVKLLVQHGASLDTRDHSGWSPIFYAVWNDNLEMVQELLLYGPSLNGVDTSGNSLTVIAKARNNSEILRALKLQ